MFFHRQTTYGNGRETVALHYHWHKSVVTGRLSGGFHGYVRSESGNNRSDIGGDKSRLRVEITSY